MSEHYKKPNLKNIFYDDFIKKIPSLKGKTIAITGTTSGTGFFAADAVAGKAARVILLNRTSDRAISSLKKLQKKNPSAEFIKIECDLQDFKSVRKAAARTLSHCEDGLDVLCNNAGIMALKDEATVDGFDIQMQTNHLSHFLLTKELMPALKIASKKRSEARIVNHSSSARKVVKKLEEKYLEKRGGNLGGNNTMMIPFPSARWKRYGQTKLANAAFTACLHEKLSKSSLSIKALVAHPGLAITELQSTTIKDGGMGRWITGIMMGIGQTAEDGAMGIIKCIAGLNASSGDFYGPGSGAFAPKGKAERFDLEPSYDNPETKNLLWEKSCEAIGEKFEIN